MNRHPSSPPTTANEPDAAALAVEPASEARQTRLPLAAPDLAALTTAMAVATGVYARNRMFAFFKDPEVRRARDRASLLRGIVRQLAGSHGDVVALSLTRHPRDAARCKLTYRIPRIRLERAVELAPDEAACLAYLVERAGSSVLVPTESDRKLVEIALRRLIHGVDVPQLEV